MFSLVQERWHHHHYLNSCWGTVVRFPQVWSTCPRRALYTETLLPGTSWWMVRKHARWENEKLVLHLIIINITYRLQTLECPEISLIVTIMCHREARFQSSGQLQRYIHTISNTAQGCWYLFAGNPFQEVLHSQWCVELWCPHVWNMESRTQTIWRKNQPSGLNM